MGIEDGMGSQIKKPDDIEPEEITTDNKESLELTEEEKELNFAEEIVDANYVKIGEIAEAIKENIGIDIDFESIDKDTLKDAFRKVSVAMGKINIEALKLGSLVDKRIAAVSILLIPLMKKAIEIEKKQLEGEKFSYAEKWKEMAKIILPENEEEDYDNIDKAGELLEKLGGTLGGKKAVLVMIFAKLLKNGEFQKGISEKFREWLEDNKNEEEREESIRKVIEEKLSEQ
ncbi:MAG: hypothetical protein KAQ64_01515 [Candidatus Pacebacteria bacterium]|nr:hypothetical protein [Candidatus Paceibacterota bacterium]